MAPVVQWLGLPVSETKTLFPVTASCKLLNTAVAHPKSIALTATKYQLWTNCLLLPMDLFLGVEGTLILVCRLTDEIRLVLSDSCDPTDCVACRIPLSMEFSRQEYWSGLPLPSPGDLLNPGIEPGSPVLRAESLPSEPPSCVLFLL